MDVEELKTVLSKVNDPNSSEKAPRELKYIYTICAESAGYSAGNYAKISINEVRIDMEKNENNHYRGLHIVVINTTTGQVETAKVFDTYESSASFDEFISTEIPAGHIVIAVAKDEVSTNLSEAGMQWFLDMGSEEIRNLDYREGFAFIGQSGGQHPVEKRAMGRYSDTAVT